MRKLIWSLGLVLGFSAMGQNGANEILPAPTSSSPHILVDTLFTLSNYPAAYTDVYIHFANPTANNVKGVQFRLFYDNVKFSNIEAFWGPTGTNISTKYGSYYKSSNWINISGVYTGSNPNFSWSDGAMFKLRLYHSAQYNGVSSSITISGSTSYSNLATTGNGTDINLSLYSYGGGFQMSPMTYPVRTFNFDGTDAPNIHSTLYKKLKTASGWTVIASNKTDSTGRYAYTHPLDTHYYNLRLTLNTDSLSDGGSLNITDAYKINNAVTMQDTLSGIEFFQSDINENGAITVSDVFAMFNRLSLGLNTWSSLFTGKNNVKIVTPAQRTQIMGNNVYSPSDAPAYYAYDSIVNGKDSTVLYVYVLGDATGTGYLNQAMIMAKMANPSQGTDYVLDPIVYYSNKPDSVEFRIPRLTLSEDNYINVPVTMYTFGNKVGAAQLGLQYDTNIFEFESVITSDAVGKWISILKSENGKILWAGHEDPMNPSVINGPYDAFSFRFRVKSILNWRTSPISIYDKAAGDENANDLNIRRSPNDGSVINGKAEMDPTTLQMLTGFLVYPNPASDFIILEFYTEDFTDLSVGIYDASGALMVSQNQKVTERGFNNMGVNISHLPNGFYFVKANTNDREKVYKIVKY